MWSIIIQNFYCFAFMMKYRWCNVEHFLMMRNVRIKNKHFHWNYEWLALQAQHTSLSDTSVLHKHYATLQAQICLRWCIAHAQHLTPKALSSPDVELWLRGRGWRLCRLDKRASGVLFTDSLRTPKNKLEVVIHPVITTLHQRLSSICHWGGACCHWYSLPTIITSADV